LKQIIQSPKSGKLELAEVPAPAIQAGCVLVRNAYSVVSPGTERLMMDFARKSMLGKARSRPDLVRQVVRKVRNDGPLAAYRIAMSRLETPQSLGYSCAGVVEAVGEGESEFAPGDHVACAGAGYANHAEFVVVPENLVVPVPRGLDLERAAFATIGAIALQGLRIAGPTLGEVGVVIGLGLIGQLALQMLRANGCRVLGIDVNAERVDEALGHGAEWAYTSGSIPGSWIDVATAGYGADFALVTAAASTAAPIHQAAELCRRKGRVVLVGMMPMELERRTFYEKELELRMSTSYGPGRYDRSYEENGLDYPLPYVRWTENRNLRSFLTLVASGAVDPGKLRTTEVPFAEAEAAYEALAQGRNPSVAVIFRYDDAPDARREIPLTTARDAVGSERLGISVLGAGNYARGMLLPLLAARRGVGLRHVIAVTGAEARHAAERFGVASCGTDPALALGDDVHLVVIATRHDSHAELAEQALRAGKAVWVEKPLALDSQGIDRIVEAVGDTGGFLTMGFNRRFSAHARAIRVAFEQRTGPLSIHYTVAAGAPPPSSWVMDPREGGGRIVGEACHFVDLCTFLLGELPRWVFARRLSPDPKRDDSTVILLQYPSGSLATIEYLARTQPDLPKERFEVSGEGRTARCENFRLTRINGAKAVRTLNQDKGQEHAIEEVIAAVRSGAPSPFSLDEVVSVTLATFAAEESIRTGQAVDLESFADAGRGER
jgi:polar amino acid transport system substrate-binding protein